MSEEATGTNITPPELAEDDELGRDTPAATNGAGGPTGASIVEQLREQRRKLGEQRSATLEIPGYNGMLWVRYKAVEWDSLKEIATRAQESKSARKELYGHADVLIVSCDEILVKDPSREDKDEHGLSPLIPNKDAPTKFDRDLASYFKSELANNPKLTARMVVLDTFMNDLAVTAQQNELMEWAASSRPNDDDEFEGKSEGTPLSS